MDGSESTARILAIAGDVVFRGLGDTKVAFAKVELVKVEFAELLSMDTAVWTSVERRECFFA